MASYDAPFPHVDPVEIGINEAFNQMIFCLNHRRETVLAAYRDLKQAKRLQAETTRNYEQKLLESTSTNPQFQQIDLTESMIDQSNTRIVFHSDTVLLRELIAELGKVFEEVSIPPRYADMRPIVAVGKRGTAPGELYSPHAVAVDPNNRNFVTEGDASESHARISVFSDRGEFLTSFTHQDMREPWGLAIHGDYLYVTDTELHTIFLFKMEAQFSLVTKQGTRGSLIGHFNCPLNLAVSTSGNVYVADCRNNRVQILNSSLQHLRTLTEQRIESPCDVKLTADKVYVLCRDNPCVHLFSHAGEKLRSLLSSGYLMPVANPNFFCLDAAENIIISDNSAHRIQIFSKEGNLIKTVGEEGHQHGMFRYPTGLALTKELSLVVVSSNSNFTFHIFSSY